MDMAGLVTLTSDFGLRDPYVAAMKGILCRHCTGVQVVDLTHDITAQGILEGALFLAGATPYFPLGTIHVAVVDPGVGTERRAIAVLADGQYYVCPDNGLLTLIVREHTVEKAHAITNPAFMLETVSATFHARDVFAPTAARLAAGASIEEAGEAVTHLTQLEIPAPEVDAQGGISGRIIHTDRFGNLITNISLSLLAGRRPRGVSAGTLRLDGIRRTYADVRVGEPLALFGSSDHLEIAVNHAHAGRELGLGVDDVVRVHL